MRGIITRDVKSGVLWCPEVDELRSISMSSVLQSQRCDVSWSEKSHWKVRGEKKR